ncbi:PEP-CTERM sorting domain-containing protein [uncultured Shimia sp.]|nr:PEP-CTERM sorting domain-containing protein [uncultured Shimia sp.]
MSLTFLESTEDGRHQDFVTATLVPSPAAGFGSIGGMAGLRRRKRKAA